MNTLPRTCVYTVLTGGYETLQEQPVAADSAVPFLCLTDDPDLKSETWRIVHVDVAIGMDPIRSQRELKIRPHVHVPDFDRSLYIDNTVRLTEKPEIIFEKTGNSASFAISLHDFRKTILDEFIAVAESGLDDQARIFEQLNHYTIDCPQILSEQPFWTGLMIRDHLNPDVRKAMEIWAVHVHRYSRRDQLSANLAFHVAGISPQIMDIGSKSSRFHSWPQPTERKSVRAPSWPAPLTVVERRKLEGSHSDETDRNDALRRKLKRYKKREKALFDFGFVGVRTAAGGWIMADPRDKRSARLVASQGNVSPAALSMWHRLMAETDWTHVVDVGANYGEMLTNGGLPENAKILAVEPNPDVRRYLEKSLVASGVIAKVISAPLSDERRESELLIDLKWSGTSRLADVEGKALAAVKKIKVTTRTLTQLLRSEGELQDIKALVKIDVEGHELSVLDGILNGLDRLAAFSALIEISHLSDEDLARLFELFDVAVFDLSSEQFEAVAPGTLDRLSAILATNRFHAEDVVLRRKPQ